MSSLGTRTDLSSIKHNIPMLESLVMLLESLDASEPFELAPKLRHLTLSTHGIFTTNMLLSLPWAQLTHVDILSWSAVQCLTVIQNLASVTELKVMTLHGPLSHIVGLTDGPVLRLEHLEDLMVVAEPDITGFHECLELPSLARYTYSEGENDAGWRVSSFISLISRSSCRLALIDVSLAVAIGQDDMALLLQLLPDLAHLNLRCWPISGINSNNLIMLLTHSATSFLAPQLEHLVLDYDKDFEFQLFFAMMESRRGANEEVLGTTGQRKPLRTVDICNIGRDGSLDNGVMERLDALAAGGSDINLLCKGTGDRVIRYSTGERVTWYVRRLDSVSALSTDSESSGNIAHDVRWRVDVVQIIADNSTE